LKKKKGVKKLGRVKDDFELKRPQPCAGQRAKDRTRKGGIKEK